MFNFDEKFMADFSRQIEDAIMSITNFDEGMKTGKINGKDIIELLKKRLQSMLSGEDANYIKSEEQVPITNKRRQEKAAKIFSGEQEVRYKSGSSLEVISTENWIATGLMNEMLDHQLSKNYNVVIDENGFMIETGVEESLISDLVDGASGEPYPLSVDLRIKRETGSKYGLVGLFDGQPEDQTSIILDMLVNEYTKLENILK